MRSTIFQKNFQLVFFIRGINFLTNKFCHVWALRNYEQDRAKKLVDFFARYQLVQKFLCFTISVRNLDVKWFVINFVNEAS